ncbi:MAG TPA: BTAD domain-containing putative transcriptional regulator [Acidimicrobiales bacterium]
MTIAEQVTPLASEPLSQSRLAIQLMGRFRVLMGLKSLVLPTCAMRVVAFLALHPVEYQRSHVAGQLWPDVTEQRARANLRNAVWKANTTVDGLVEGDTETIRLRENIEVDVAVLRITARDLLERSHPMHASISPDIFAEEMLLGWEDDWALFERERIKQLCLHALETLSLLHLEAGAPAAAIDAALLAVRLEPLRESAHRAISRAHLEEGNIAQAVRQFEAYRALLHRELALTPSAGYHQLLGKRTPAA